MRKLALAIALAASGMASAQSIVDGTGSDIEPNLLSKVLTTVSDHTRDPESSRLRRLKVGTSKNLRAICGEINSKNGYGAYAGYSQFVYFLKTGEAIVYPSDLDEKTTKEVDETRAEAGC